MRNDDKRTILIAGPTASGKSGLALALAERLDGVVINADSMQVYRELRILTARPSVEEEARAPHLLYGHVAGADAYSAGRYAADAGEAIKMARGMGRVPIVVGGTGLYFKTLLEGLSPIPVIPDDIRAYWRAEGQRIGPASLHATLGQRDPEMAARLAATDTQRLVRALEVLDATGRSLAEWQRMPGTPIVRQEEAVRLVLSPDRDVLYARCNARLDAMIRAAALEEVAALAALQLPTDLPVMRAVGVRPLMAHVEEEIDLESAIERSKAETRQYAKRQMTWLRSNMIAWSWLTKQQTECVAREAIAVICS